ncbi:MAG: matrixin family metalloprotease [Streptococcus salivarius]
MKKLFRVIFYSQTSLQFIWNLIWAIFKLALVLALIGYGLVYYANNSSSTLATNINQAFHQVELGFSGTSTSDVEKVVSNLSTTDTIPESNGARWAQNTASIYIQSTDETLVAAYRAITNWNNTIAFIFTLTDDASTADIVATDYSDANSQAAGLADSQTNVLTNRITHVDVKLNRYFLLNSDFGYTHKRIVNTAEHELGHAIGLDHDDSKTSVMQSAGSYYGIQQVDIDTVHSLYAN